MTTPAAKPAETSLAEHVPPLDADHKASLEAYLSTNARDLTDTDFDAMVRLFRAQRRADASARLERDRKRTETTARKAALAEKRAAKAAAGAVAEALAQDGGEGASK